MQINTMNLTKKRISSGFLIAIIAALFTFSAAAQSSYIGDVSISAPDQVSADSEFPVSGSASGSQLTEIKIREDTGAGWYLLEQRDCSGSSCPEISTQTSQSQTGYVTYQVKAFAQGDGIDAVAEKTVRVEEGNQAPNPSISVSDNSPNTGEQVRFDGSTSFDSDGEIVEYQWDFDNDGDFEGSGETDYYSYGSAGEYTVTLRVEDDDGSTSTTTATVDVQEIDQNESPHVDFSYDPQSPEVGESIKFSSSAYDPDGNDNQLDLDWDFDNDGNFEGNGETDYYTFETSGSKTVTLRATDEEGASKAAERTINVRSGGFEINSISPRGDVSSPVEISVKATEGKDHISYYECFWERGDDVNKITHNLLERSGNSFSIEEDLDEGSYAISVACFSTKESRDYEQVGIESTEIA